MAPAGTTEAALIVDVLATGGAGEVHYIDQLGLWQGASTTWRAPVTLPNNQPVLQFDHVDDDLTATLPLPGPSTIYVVANNQAGEGALVAFRDGGNPYAHLVDIAAGYLRGLVSDDVGVGAIKVLTPPAIGTAFVATSVRSLASTTTTMSLYLNGVGGVGSSQTLGTLTQSRLDIGAIWTAGYGLAGTIACVIVCAGAHDDATRKRIEQWLGARYGITVA
jgi:hypothetical protein